MNLSITPIQKNIRTRAVSFNAHNNQAENPNAEREAQNPISRTGETMNIVKATFLGGMALGARLLWELLDGDFLFEHAGRKASALVDQNRRELTGAKRDLYKVGATIGLLVAGVSAFAILYTVLNAPKIAYKGKVNTFKKEKEMDVYIKANEAEKGIYTELSEKAKVADETERDHLKEQYMQMKMAKNEVPEFARSNKPKR